MTSKIDVERLKPTPELIEEARLNPNGWVYAINGKFSSSDALPTEVVVGAWQVGADGTIVEGSFVANPLFREGSTKLRWFLQGAIVGAVTAPFLAVGYAYGLDLLLIGAAVCALFMKKPSTRLRTLAFCLSSVVVAIFTWAVLYPLFGVSE